MSIVTDLSAIQHEASIVWVDTSARALPYVREGFLPFFKRSRPPSCRLSSRLVAYATLSPSARAKSPGMFERRYWYLAAHDPYHDGGGPTQSVNPLSIAPRVLSSRMTDEQWNRLGSRYRDY